MTVSSTQASESFACDGVTVLFTCPFRVLAAADMQVFLKTLATGAVQQLVNGIDFNVSTVGSATTGVTTVATYSSAYELRCKRKTTRLQETDYRDNDPFPAETHERALDRLTMAVQEDDEAIGRTIRSPDGEEVEEMPNAGDRANKLLGFDADGNPVAIAPADGSAASLAASLVDSTLALQVARIEAGGGNTDYDEASYLSRKNIGTHAWYDFLSNSVVSYAGGAPIYGHASFNDNNTFAGAVASDHHHSFQSYPHYGTAATISVLSSFWSQIDATAGTISEASGLKFNNPSGAGTITNLYGVLIGALTRGASNNIGVYVGGASGGSGNNHAFFSAGDDVPCHFGGPVGLGRGITGYGQIYYEPDTGHITIIPRTGFNTKIAGDTGQQTLRIGPHDVDTFDALIENAADGRLKITPRSGFGIQLTATTECTALIASLPVVLPTYTVATVPSAATYVRGLIYVSNESGGATTAFSDGVNWRRHSDRAIVT